MRIKPWVDIADRGNNCAEAQYEIAWQSVQDVESDGHSKR